MTRACQVASSHRTLTPSRHRTLHTASTCRRFELVSEMGAASEWVPCNTWTGPSTTREARATESRASPVTVDVAGGGGSSGWRKRAVGVGIWRCLPPYIVYLYLCDMSCREINPSFGRDPQAKPILNTPNLTPTTPPTPHSPAKRLRTTS